MTFSDDLAQDRGQTGQVEYGLSVNVLLLMIGHFLYLFRLGHLRSVGILAGNPLDNVPLVEGSPGTSGHR